MRLSFSRADGEADGAVGEADGDADGNCKGEKPTCPELVLACVPSLCSVGCLACVLCVFIHVHTSDFQFLIVPSICTLALCFDPQIARP